MSGSLYGWGDTGAITPVLAHKANVSVGGMSGTAINSNITYQQQVNRRKVIGGAGTLLWACQPGGQATIQRMVTNGGSVTMPGYDSPSRASFEGGVSISCEGCVGAQYSVVAEVEGLTIVDNIVLDCITCG